MVEGDGQRAAGCVLVIDDDATARELIAHHVKGEGFAVVTASGGLDELKLAKQVKPTVFTLDVMMPDLDGWSVLAALREDSELADVPVIMVTILDEQRRGAALGAAGYLTKPIDRERLRRLLDRFRTPARPTQVLVVEDDPYQRERMRALIEGQDSIVQEAANGREALDRLQESKPDLILLDLMMPEMDGFQVVATLQKEAAWRDIPVIVIHSARSRCEGPRALELRRRNRARQGSFSARGLGRPHPADHRHVSLLNVELGPKRLELLHELVPAVTVMGLVIMSLRPSIFDRDVLSVDKA